MERVKRVQAKLGFDDARQTLGSIRVRQGSDLVGDGRGVSIYPILRTSTLKSHQFASSTAGKRCVSLRRRTAGVISWGGRADLFTKHLTGAMAGEMVVSAPHVLFLSFSRFRH